MWTFLTVILALVVGLPLALLVTWHILKWKLKSAFGELGEAFKQMGEVMGTRENLRLTLVRDESAAPSSPDWANWTAGFASVGLTSAGIYRTEEDPDVALHAFVDEARSFFAVVYNKPPVGVFTDVVTSYPDGRIVTHTTLHETGLDRPDWQTTVRPTVNDAAELVQAHLRQRHAGDPEPVTASRFKSMFEREYARCMDWRMVRGLTKDEARRQLIAGGETEIDDSAIEMTVGMIRAKYDAEMETFLKDQGRKTRGLTKDAWDKLEHRVFVITEKTTPSDAADTFLSHSGGWDDDEEHDNGRADLRRSELVIALSKGDIRSAFRSQVEAMSGPNRIEFITSAEGPVDGDVYLGAESDEDDGSYDDDDE